MEPSNEEGFFPGLVREVVGPYLAQHGFSLNAAGSTRVTFGRDRVRISLAFFVEDRPTPWVAVDIGMADDDGRDRLIGLWRVIPSDAPGRAFTSWTFKDPGSLRNALHRIVVEVLDVHARELWEEPSRLVDEIHARDEEIANMGRERQLRKEIREARRAFTEGRYQAVIDKLVLVGTDGLSAGDRRRLHQARKLLGTSPRGTESGPEGSSAS